LKQAGSVIEIYVNKGGNSMQSTLCINEKFVVLNDSDQYNLNGGGFLTAVAVVSVCVLIVAAVSFAAGVVYEAVIAK
jgi:hypothetical protein